MTIDNVSFRLRDIRMIVFNDAEYKFTLYEYDGGSFEVISTKANYTKNKKILENHFKEEK